MTYQHDHMICIYIDRRVIVSLAHQFLNHLFGLFVKLPCILKSSPHYYPLPFWWPILRPAKLVGDLFLVVGSKIL